MAGKVVAILGATGVVGRQMLQCLEERDFPVSELVPLASARSAGKTVTFRGEEVVIREAVPEAFEGIDPTQKLDEITTLFRGVPLSADLAGAEVGKAWRVAQGEVKED